MRVTRDAAADDALRHHYKNRSDSDIEFTMQKESTQLCQQLSLPYQRPPPYPAIQHLHPPSITSTLHQHPPLEARHRVAQQHCDGHGADTARDWRHRPRERKSFS